MHGAARGAHERPPRRWRAVTAFCVVHVPPCGLCSYAPPPPVPSHSGHYPFWLLSPPRGSTGVGRKLRNATRTTAQACPLCPRPSAFGSVEAGVAQTAFERPHLQTRPGWPVPKACPPLMPLFVAQAWGPWTWDRRFGPLPRGFAGPDCICVTACRMPALGPSIRLPAVPTAMAGTGTKAKGAGHTSGRPGYWVRPTALSLEFQVTQAGAMLEGTAMIVGRLTL